MCAVLNSHYRCNTTAISASPCNNRAAFPTPLLLQRAGAHAINKEFERTTFTPKSSILITNKFPVRTNKFPVRTSTQPHKFSSITTRQKSYPNSCPNSQSEHILNLPCILNIKTYIHDLTTCPLAIQTHAQIPSQNIYSTFPAY